MPLSGNALGVTFLKMAQAASIMVVSVDNVQKAGSTKEIRDVKVSNVASTNASPRLVLTAVGRVTIAVFLQAIERWVERGCGRPWGF